MLLTRQLYQSIQSMEILTAGKAGRICDYVHRRTSPATDSGGRIYAHIAHNPHNALLSLVAEIKWKWRKFQFLEVKEVNIPGRGVLNEKLRSQLVWQNLKGPLSCGMCPWKLNTLSALFSYSLLCIPNTHKILTFKTKHIFHTFYGMGGLDPLFCVYRLPHNLAFSNPLSTHKVNKLATPLFSQPA